MYQKLSGTYDPPTIQKLNALPLKFILIENQVQIRNNWHRVNHPLEF